MSIATRAVELHSYLRELTDQTDFDSEADVSDLMRSALQRCALAFQQR